MKCEGIWSIKNLLKEGLHPDYLIFLDNKYEFFDSFGEHIYFPLTVYAKTNHILPLGEIAQDHEMVLKILEESGCDMFSIIDRKNLLSLNYMKQEEMWVLSIEKKSLSLGFATFISDKYEYKGIDGADLYSPESIWLSAKEKSISVDVKEEYFEACRLLRNNNCYLFELI